MGKYYNQENIVKIEGGRYIIGHAPTVEEAEKIVASFNNPKVKTVLNHEYDSKTTNNVITLIDEIEIVEEKEVPATPEEFATTGEEMAYVEYCNEVFFEHHSAMGMDSEEIQDVIEGSTPAQRARWMVSAGYDLWSMYKNDVLEGE